MFCIAEAQRTSNVGTGMLKLEDMYVSDNGDFSCEDGALICLAIAMEH